MNEEAQGAARLARSSPSGNTDPTSTDKIPTLTLIALIGPAAITDLAILVIAYVIPAYYAKTTPLSLEVIGAVMLSAKLFDAVSDPMMGVMSDRIETRYGRRKPWLVLGAPIFLLGLYILLTPGADSGLLYFVAGWMLLYFGYTVFAVPYSAWQLELVRNYDQRQRVVTYRTFASFTGAVLFVAAPLIMSSVTGTTEFTGDVLKAIAIFCCIAMAILTLVALIAVPQETRLSQKRPALSELTGIVLRNRPFQIFAFAYLLWGLGAGAWAKLTYIFVDSYLGIAEYFSIILGVTFLTRLIALPVWQKLLKTREKSQVWALSLLALAAILPIYFFIPRGLEGLLFVFALSVLIGIFDAAVMLLPLSFTGDIADYDTYETGNDRTATYKALLALMNKTFMAVGGGLAFIIVGLMGFSVTGDNSQATLFGFKFMTLIVPAVCFALAAVIIRRHPLNRSRHNEIITVIKSREALASAKAIQLED